MNGGYYDRGRQKQLARVYIPFQIMYQVYSPSEALMRGTLFPELFMPYKKRDLEEGRYYG